MKLSFFIVALGFLGLGLGVFSGRDLTRMAARFSVSNSRFPALWGLGKRLALFLAGLTLGARHGPSGILAVSVGYMTGFIFFTVRGWRLHGR